LPPLPLLHEATLDTLRNSSNLLAFSGGSDSTALFFLLQEYGIAFDIALVNYQTRALSDAEESYAKELGARYGKKVFTFTCKLGDENFEHKARLVRYTFFEQLIREHGYTTLLTAHHLNDTLEWFLMQLCRGAGVVEMVGMRTFEDKEDYTLIRPLLHLPKSMLLEYLHTKQHSYFIDESNATDAHLRNYFRHHFANTLLQNYATGIAKSFHYLREDAKRLLPNTHFRIHDLFVFPRQEDDVMMIRHIDKVLKRLGLVMSHAQRNEILRIKDGVVGGKIAVCFGAEFVFIAPFTRTPMPKSFKESCRLYAIPAKIRPYMYALNIYPSALHLNRKP